MSNLSRFFICRVGQSNEQLSQNPHQDDVSCAAFNLNGWLLARVEIGNYWSAASMPQPMHCDGNVLGAAVASVACCMLRIPELLTGSRTIRKQRVNFALRSHVCINACLSNTSDRMRCSFQKDAPESSSRIRFVRMQPERNLASQFCSTPKPQMSPPEDLGLVLAELPAWSLL